MADSALKAAQKESDARIKAFLKSKKRHIPASERAAEMKNPDNLIEFDGLKTYFYTDIGTVKAVDGVTFDVPRGKTVGIVGESGCGKSVTSLSLMRLLQEPQGQITGGEIRYLKDRGGKAVNLARLPVKEARRIYGNEIAMIFQEPMTSLNPVFTAGSQIGEAIKLHNPRAGSAEIKSRTVEMLRMVGIARAEGIYKSYPHELSGGMRQRVMIAIALACSPSLIIADEPTTALDVTIQAQILDLMRELKSRIKASIMLITHDLGVVAEMADYVVVMYAGRVIEKGAAGDIYYNPRHPYTIGLLGSKPVLGRETERLYSIPGNVPNPINMPDCCYFKERCGKAFAPCGGVYPPLVQLSETHSVSCWLCAEGGGGK
jgi:peptide/nickel transport system ATP-binding protein